LTGSVETVIEDIRASTMEHLNQTTTGCTPTPQLFLIDSYATDKYDFKLLTDKLLHELHTAAEPTSLTTTHRRCVIC